jgi:hypothetical protein
MSPVSRTIMMLVPLAIVSSCLLGFWEMFEPLDGGIHRAWRIADGVLGTACLAIAWWLARSRK